MRVFLIFTILLSVPCVAVGDDAVAVIAHRGGAALGVENTLSCIEAGIAAGADAVEVDVRLTKDGHFVVFHNARVDDLTGGKGKISEMTLGEVQALRLVGGDGCFIPTLEQVLALVAGRCGVLIDIKDAGASFCGGEQALIDVIEACGAVEWVAVQSFNDGVLERLHELGAPFPLEKLIAFKVPFLPLVVDDGLRFFSLKRYAHISSFNFGKRLFPAALARKIRKAGKGVKVWTVSSPVELSTGEVDGVITDNPHLWKR